MYSGLACSLTVNTAKYICFCAASTSFRIHARACNKARKSGVASSAGCRLSHPRCDSRLPASMDIFPLQLRVLLSSSAVIFACHCGYFCLRVRVFWLKLQGIFACFCGYFSQRVQVTLPAFAGKIDCKSRLFSMPVAGKNAKFLQVNYL